MHECIYRFKNKFYRFRLKNEFLCTPVSTHLCTFMFFHNISNGFLVTLTSSYNANLIDFNECLINCKLKKKKRRLMNENIYLKKTHPQRCEKVNIISYSSHAASADEPIMLLMKCCFERK